MAEDSENTLKVAHQAFQHYKHGLATGEWNQVLDMLTEDFSFWFPVAKYHGFHLGKERAREFFQYVSECFKSGLTLTLDRVTSHLAPVALLQLG